MNKISSRILRGIRELGLVLSLALSVNSWLSGLVATLLSENPKNWQMLIFVFPLTFVVLLFLCSIGYHTMEQVLVKKFRKQFKMGRRIRFWVEHFDEGLYRLRVKEFLKGWAFNLNDASNKIKHMRKQSFYKTGRYYKAVEEFIKNKDEFWKAHNLAYALGIVEKAKSFKDYLP